MAPPLPELPNDSLAEILLLLPEDDPACLIRASIVHKPFHAILANPLFQRRYAELHPTPPVLGTFHNAEGDATCGSRFVPYNLASGRPPARDLPWRRVIDCRHSRVLFLAPRPSLGTKLSYDLVVWNPLTNEYRCLPPPSPPLEAVSTNDFNAAVLCSVRGCDHRNCHGGHFLVALVCLLPGAISARVYDSETDKWSVPVSAQHPVMFMHMTPHPSTLIGDTLYFRCGFGYALEYQPRRVQRLSFIQGPPGAISQSWAISLMPMKGGGLGCMYVEDDRSGLRLRQWSWKEGSDGVFQWTRGDAIELNNLLPDGALASASNSSPKIQLLGFAEAANAIFVGTWSRNHPDAVYMVELNSATKARRLFNGYTVVVPYTSFCLPVQNAASTTVRPGDNASGPQSPCKPLPNSQELEKSVKVFDTFCKQKRSENIPQIILAKWLSESRLCR